MPTLQPAKASRETLNLRIKPELRGLIDRAAELTGKNRTDFVLNAARHAAEDALLDRAIEGEADFARLPVDGPISGARVLGIIAERA